MLLSIRKTISISFIILCGMTMNFYLLMKIIDSYFASQLVTLLKFVKEKFGLFVCYSFLISSLLSDRLIRLVQFGLERFIF